MSNENKIIRLDAYHGQVEHKGYGGKGIGIWRMELIVCFALCKLGKQESIYSLIAILVSEFGTTCRLIGHLGTSCLMWLAMLAGASGNPSSLKWYLLLAGISGLLEMRELDSINGEVPSSIILH